MALDYITRIGSDDAVLPLEIPYDTPLEYRLDAAGTRTARVYFIEYTGEVAHPRKGGAVIRVGYSDGCTDTLVAGELCLEKIGNRPMTAGEEYDAAG